LNPSVVKYGRDTSEDKKGKDISIVLEATNIA
jgi:hypothetical protein